MPPARRRLQALPTVHTGHPAPFWLGAPTFAAAAAGWLAAAVAFTAAADDLSRGAVSTAAPVLAAHLVGLVLFPFAVAGAVWQLLPVMLRNDPPTAPSRPLALALLGSGSVLAVAVALDADLVAAAAAALLGCGLLLLLAEAAALVLGAPAGKRLVVSRPAVAVALAHAAVAFALGAVALADGGPEPLGIGYERFLLLHLTVALVGWLTVLIAAVGRTLVPMLGGAAALPPRRVPATEAVLVAGLWIFAAGLALPSDAAVAAGLCVLLLGLAPTARLAARVVRAGTQGAREGPVLHVAAGLVLAVEAGLLGLAAVAGLAERRQAAVAAVVLLGAGWAAGVILGHLGKLLSLAGWGSWPPGPRPRQAALYPRRLWQAEVALFAPAVQLLGVGVLAESAALARVGGVLLVGSALLATAAVAETLRRVAAGRRAG